MEKTIYVVEASSGSYDDVQYWIEGIFEIEQTAIDCRDTVLKEIKDTIASKSPIEGCDDYKLLPKTLSDEDYDKWSAWYWKKDEALEFNDCTITPYTLNKRVKP